MKKENLIVHLDYGHGGPDDKDAVHEPAVESMIVMGIGALLTPLLTSEGFYVSHSRTVDLPVTLEQRCHLAKVYQTDLFLSLHCNSHSSPGANGIEVFTSPGQTKADPLATHLIHSLQHSFPDSRYRCDFADGDPDKEAKFFVLQNTPMPAALVEFGFLSNPKERKWLLDKGVQFRLAAALCSGLLTWRDTL